MFVDRDFQTPLLMYKQQVLQMFVLSLIDSDSTLRQTSLKGIHEMVLMKQFLNREEVKDSINAESIFTYLLIQGQCHRQSFNAST